nr:hypothetical protein [Limobrevibacterium gyesilva]
MERLVARLPPWARPVVEWLLRPQARLIRIPAAVILVAFGVLGFLPVLGFWMIPLGGLLLAQDLPFLRRPMLRGLEVALDGWDALCRRLHSSDTKGR